MAVPEFLNPADYTVVPHVAAVDEFVMRNDDGSFVANVNAQFLTRLVARMQQREDETGDLAPIVIGHTTDGQPETLSPPVVGYARNWHVGPLFNTNRKAAFFDAWIKNDRVEEVRNYPRRSCEVWPGRYEADPISLLGATTPARDLGMMKLSREGSFTYTCPDEDTPVADEKIEEKKEEKKDGPKADPKQTGAAVKEDSKQDQILALLQQVLQALQGGSAGAAGGAGAAAATAAPGAPSASPDAGAAGAAGDPNSMSDADIEKLLAEMGGSDGAEGGAGAGAADAAGAEGRKGEEKVKNMGAPGGDNTYVHLQRSESELRAQLAAREAENEDLRVKLSRREVQDALQSFYNEGLDVPTGDETVISDLISMPPEVRNRQLQTVKKLARPRLDAQNGGMLGQALEQAAGANPAGHARRATKDDVVRLSRKALAEGKSFEAVARAEGFLTV